MENQFKEEIEALETLKDYNVKIIKALKEVVPELRGEKREDTDEYLRHILKGINWEIEVINGTKHYINRESEKISKEDINHTILKLNDAIQGKQNVELVDILENEMLPFLESLSIIV